MTTPEAVNTAAARIVASIDALLEKVDQLDPGWTDRRTAMVANVRELARSLIELHQATPAEPVALEDPEAVLEGLWGDYGWELGHGSESVVLTWRGAGGVISDQASPFEAVLFARSIEAQAYAVLEGHR